MSFRRLDEWCVEQAALRAAMQPRCDYTYEQLPRTGTASPTDLIAIERNGITYGMPISVIPTQVIGSIGFFNVVDYGADPTGVTNSTSAITAAIAAAQAAGGGIVYFPQGTYLVSSTITIPANGISLMGAGSGAAKIQSAPTVIAPSVFQTTSGVSYVTISQLGFFGNSVNPTPSPNAPSVIVYNGGVDNKVFNCYFTGNTGDCVDFLGVTDGEVWSNRFLGTGYNGAGSSNTLVTPAVFADSASVGVRIHHNYFQGCKYFGILLLGTDCEASFNNLKSTGNAAIRVGAVSSSGEGNGSRVFGNIVDTVLQNPVDSAGGSGIYLEGVINFQVLGNYVTMCDSDGIVLAACQQGGCNNNDVSNCCQQGNDCGIQYNPQAGSAPNSGVTIVGNAVYDNQATPTMLNGIRVLGPGSGGAVYCTIVGNSLSGFTGTVGATAQRGLNATDSILDDDTNIIEGNTDWLDRQHLGTASTTVPASTTATAVGTPAGSVLASVNVEKGVMGLNRAVRLTAYGVATIATGITFLLSFGSTLGNVVNFPEATTGTAQPWRLEMWLNSGDNNNVQHFSYVLYYHGILVASGGGNLAVDTTMDNPLELQATTGSGDSITCNGYTYSRE
jgi:hypothetical protein